MTAGRVYQRKWILVRLPIAVLALAAMALLWHWLLPMPPSALTLSSGMPDGVYHAHAQRYAERFAAHGVTLRLQTSEGALQNLRRLRGLEAPSAQLAFMQGGVVVTGSGGEAGARLQTIARVDYEPLWIFTRLPGIDALQQLQGRRVSLGPRGSGTRQLATTLLAQARMEPSDLLDSELSGSAALEALRQGQLDAVVMVMAAGAPLVRSFLQLPGVQLVQLGRSAALIERLPYLQARLLPAGALDPLARLPARDTTVLVTTASLLAPANLAPALQRLAAAVARSAFMSKRTGHVREVLSAFTACWAATVSPSAVAADHCEYQLQTTAPATCLRCAASNTPRRRKPARRWHTDFRCSSAACRSGGPR